jgi:ACS family tartrate transporter-like MFS transporter
MTDHERMDPNVGRGALKKISWRLLPLLCVGYGIAYMDRVNISFAALQMNDELHFSATVYGLGGGLFFLSYCLLEIPSNLLLVRFGARRWISRIMFTWGILAVGMMFVKTPAQFYLVRFMLGAAEAGFFPGVLFYLSNWYPEAQSGRAISRFYVALPISVAFMGAIAAPLLNLRGTATLSGWQWLFLVEGIPAIIVSALILGLLPDNPEQAHWLSPEEKQWIVSRVSVTENSARAPDEHRLGSALTSAFVWKYGLCNLLIMGSAYAFNLSAPALLKVATHWETGSVGILMSGTALAGAVSMLFNGWHSDRYNERYLHTIVPLGLMASSLGVIGSNNSPVLVVPAYVTYYLSSMAVQSAFWPLASNTLRGSLSAVGLAAIGSIGMFGGFLGPFIWGVARDHTGSYRTGLLTLGVLYAAVAAILLLLRSETRRSRVVVFVS